MQKTKGDESESTTVDITTPNPSENGSEASREAGKERLEKLLSLLGSLKEDPAFDFAWQEVEAYRRRVDEEERARLDGQPAK